MSDKGTPKEEEEEEEEPREQKKEEDDDSKEKVVEEEEEEHFFMRQQLNRVQRKSYNSECRWLQPAPICICWKGKNSKNLIKKGKVTVFLTGIDGKELSDQDQLEGIKEIPLNEDLEAKFWVKMKNVSASFVRLLFKISYSVLQQNQEEEEEKEEEKEEEEKKEEKSDGGSSAESSPKEIEKKRMRKKDEQKNRLVEKNGTVLSEPFHVDSNRDRGKTDNLSRITINMCEPTEGRFGDDIWIDGKFPKDVNLLHVLFGHQEGKVVDCLQNVIHCKVPNIRVVGRDPIRKREIQIKIGFGEADSVAWSNNYIKFTLIDESAPLPQEPQQEKDVSEAPSTTNSITATTTTTAAITTPISTTANKLPSIIRTRSRTKPSNSVILPEKPLPPPAATPIAFGVQIPIPPLQRQNEAILLKASFNGDLENIKRLAGIGINVNISDERGDTPLILACSQSKKVVAEQLLQFGAAPAKTNNDGGLLHYAALVGNTDIVRLLIRSGSPIDCRAAKTGFTPLHNAVWRRQEETISFLLSTHLANPNQQTMDQHTALHLACIPDESGKCANIRILSLLLNSNADVRIVDKNKMLAVHYLVRSANEEEAKLILQTCNAVDSTANPLQTIDNKGNTLLHIASFAGNFAMVNMLIKWPLVNWPHSNILERNFLGQTCLHAACMSNSFEIVQLLVLYAPRLLIIPDLQGNLPQNIQSTPQIIDFLRIITISLK